MRGVTRKYTAQHSGLRCSMSRNITHRIALGRLADSHHCTAYCAALARSSCTFPLLHRKFCAFRRLLSLALPLPADKSTPRPAAMARAAMLAALLVGLVASAAAQATQEPTTAPTAPTGAPSVPTGEQPPGTMVPTAAQLLNAA